jgi:hypothetical protein
MDGWLPELLRDDFDLDMARFFLKTPELTLLEIPPCPGGTIFPEI